MNIQMLKEELLRYITDLRKQWKSYEKEIELAYRYWVVVNMRLELLEDSLYEDSVRQQLLQSKKTAVTTPDSNSTF